MLIKSVRIPAKTSIWVWRAKLMKIGNFQWRIMIWDQIQGFSDLTHYQTYVKKCPNMRRLRRFYTIRFTLICKVLSIVCFPISVRISRTRSPINSVKRMVEKRRRRLIFGHFLTYVSIMFRDKSVLKSFVTAITKGLWRPLPKGCDGHYQRVVTAITKGLWRPLSKSCDGHCTCLDIRCWMQLLQVIH